MLCSSMEGSTAPLSRSDTTIDIINKESLQYSTDWLLQGQDAALELVLQQLDPCSLACTAATCSKLRHMVPACISKVAARVSDPKTFRSLDLWLQQHSPSLTSLTQCSLAGRPLRGGDVGGPQIHPLKLPGQQLRHLQLEWVDLRPSDKSGPPEFLHSCTSLTALELSHCKVQDGPDTLAAIAAMPHRRRLSLTWVMDPRDFNTEWPLDLPSLSSLVNLTALKLEFGLESKQLSQLSSLVNLQELELLHLPKGGIPGGLPPQLVKLTSLHVGFDSDSVYDDSSAGQLQHISSLTALRALSIECRNSDGPPGNLGVGNIPGIEHLQQLTSLKIKQGPGCKASRSLRLISPCIPCIPNWSRLTALQSLSFESCPLQLEALAACAQLRELSCRTAILRTASSTSRDACLEDMLFAVQKLQLLTKLDVQEPQAMGLGPFLGETPPQAGAYAALTASTNLCSLRWASEAPKGGWALFKLDRSVVYPHLHTVDLPEDPSSGASGQRLLSGPQLQQLCSCCPALESLSFELCGRTPPTAYLPLLQLSALTHLEVRRVRVAAAAVVSTAAQLTGLRSLRLFGFKEDLKRMDPALLQLTALTDLTALELQSDRHLSGCLDHWGINLHSKASWGARPDVWVQLLRRLLCDENGSFLHTALQQPSTGPGADLQAVAVQRMLRFAATLTDLPECVRSQLKHLAASLPV